MKKPNPVHAPELCEGTFCPFHNPSDHHMKDWPTTVRYDRYCLTERLCVHGVGHPDPDSIAWLKQGFAKNPLFYDEDPNADPGLIFGLHGCCGCCVSSERIKELEEIREHADTHDLSAEMENGHWENE